MNSTFFELIPIEFAQAVFYAIFNSLMSGILIFTLLKLVVKLFRLSNPSLKYWMSYLALCTIFLITIITFVNCIGSSPGSSMELSDGYFLININQNYSIESGLINSLQSNYKLLLTTLFSYHKYLAVFWVLGFIIFMTRYFGSYFGLKKIRSRNPSSLNPKLQKITKEVSKILGLNENVSAYQCSYINTPLIYGIIKPVIVFPISFLSNLNSEQIEIIIFHELAHLKRLDPFFKALQSVIESLLFFNPTIWLLSKEIDVEREKCCDDLVTKYSQNNILYARTLLDIAEYSNAANEAALALIGNKNQLFSRIKRLVQPLSQNFGSHEKLFSNLYYSMLFSILFTFAIFSSQHLNTSTNQAESSKLISLASINSIEDALNLLSKDLETNEYQSQLNISDEKRVISLTKLMKQLNTSDFSFNNPFVSDNHDILFDSDHDFFKYENASLQKKLSNLEKRIEEINYNLEKLGKKF